MDKETLIRLAQPAATTLLALSIVSYPLISVAGDFPYNSRNSPLYVKITNAYAIGGI